MKYNLGDREWKEFKITEVFTEIKRGKRQKSEDRKPGNLAYYSASMNSNGLTDFISNPSFIIKKPSIVYSTFGDAYYVPGNFSTSDEMTILGYDGLNKYNAFFVVQALKQNKIKYSFGRKAFSNKILKDKILLPVDDLGNPDYKFMEDFIKEREKSKREKYRKYVENKLKTLGENGDFRERELLNKKWGEFKVKDIFSIIEKCKCNNASKFFDGNIPYVGATNKNNGVMRLIEADKKFITKGNCVCFVCDGQGSVGYSIYKKEDFVGSTTLKVGRFEFINEFIAQFLISALDKNRFIYSFGYKRTEERLKNEKILLPITENEEIDYEFMENYMKYLMLRKYQKYLEYIG